MTRKRKNNNPFRIAILLALVAGALYVNQVIVPATPPLFVPTPTPTRSPESFLKDAQALVGKGKINQAIESYKEAVKADPLNPAIYVTLARLQVLYGDYDGAMENVENALLLNTNHALAKAVRGWILSKQKEYQKGIVELEDSLELDPNSALAYAYLSELYLDMISDNKGDLNTLDKAIQASKDAQNHDPNLLEVHRVRGLVLQNTTQHEEAIKEFEAAIAMNENLSELHIALGISYRLTDQVERAVDAFLRAIALRPDDALPYAELAATYFKAGEYAKGIQYAQEAVDRQPEDAFQHGLLGSMYFRNFQYAEAAAALRLAVRGGVTEGGIQVEPLPLDPSDAASVAYYSRFGISLANVDQCGEALQVAQELLARIPEDENVAYNAQVMIDTCREQVDNPLPEATETPRP